MELLLKLRNDQTACPPLQQRQTFPGEPCSRRTIDPHIAGRGRPQARRRPPAARSAAAANFATHPLHVQPGLLAEEELSEEDQKLKDDLELMVTRVGDADKGVQKLAIDSLGNEIRWGGLTSAFAPHTRNCNSCGGHACLRVWQAEARGSGRLGRGTAGCLVCSATATVYWGCPLALETVLHTAPAAACIDPTAGPPPAA